ncbi:MAG: hypothetical protein DPW09_33910 [Anaerolineae bacterium]|nr:type II toxin-antitoxin system VapC family toxin [Anaerolineales bacterium]MCQ3978451.1 hypothetical protein [Anaerolineae bacterium]
MSHYYLDSSAAVKLYVAETGANWLRQLLLGESPVAVISSQLLRVELWSAFARRRREGALSASDFAQTIIWFTEHLHDLYRLTPMTEPLLQTACVLLEKYPLRGADAIHLATATLLNQQLAAAGLPPLTFLGADAHLNQAALSEGLVTLDPNQAPSS